MRLAKYSLNVFLGILFIFHNILCLADVSFARTNEPIEIEADSLSYNHKKGIAHYAGHVNAKQGQRLLSTDNLTLYRSTTKGTIERLLLQGQAVFKVKNKSNDKLIVAQADEIEFNQTTNIVILKGHASITQEGDVYKAPLIQYDLSSETIFSPASQQGRTTIYLQPNNRS